MIDTKILYPPIIDETYSCVSNTIPIDFVHTANVDTSRIIVKLQVWNKDENKWETNIVLQDVSNNSIVLQDGKIRVQAMTIAKGQVILNPQQWLEDSNNKQHHSVWSDTIEKIIINGAELNIRINNALAIEVSTTENISNNFAYLKASLYSQLEKRYLIKLDSIFYTNIIKPSDTFVIPNQVHTVNYEVEYVTKEGFSLIDSGIVDIVVNGEVESTNLNIKQSNSSLEISNPFALSDGLEVDIIRENLSNQTFERVKAASPSLETYEEKTPCIGEEYEYYLGHVEEIKNDSMNFIKDIPNKVMPYAEISKVGGMTKKCANLISYPYTALNLNKNGISASIDNAQRIVINGTCTGAIESLISEFTLPIGTYCFSAIQTSNNTRVLLTKNDDLLRSQAKQDSAYIFTVDNPIDIYRVSVIILADNTYSYDIVAPMLNSGNVALPYEPYFDGLRSARVTEVKSVGVDLIPFPYELLPESGGTKFVINPDLSIDVSGKPIRSIYETMATLTLQAGTYTLHNYGELNSTVRLYATYDDSTRFANSTFTLYKETSVRVRIAVYDTFDGNTIRIIPLLCRGSVAPQSYKPYAKHTLPIAADVQAIEGYGEGINADCYNYIDWEKKQFVKRVGAVDMGALNWVYMTEGSAHAPYFYTTFLGIKYSGDFFNITPNILCTSYKETPRHLNFFTNKCITLDGVGGVVKQIQIKDSTFTDAATFKAAMSGVMLIYELAEPIITDISDILPIDNFIEVEGGGTITMVNEYSFDVPNEIVFKTKTYLKHDKPIIVDSGDIFLATRNKILNIRYDPNITGYKYNIQAKMMPTLGAKYPKITRNGEQNYRSFTISGTIARGLEQENENADFNSTLERTYATLDPKTREFILEKRFRDNVLEFLQSPEVKLYKSLTEGNIFVYLTDVSLTPKKELGRMIYSFSALATEVAEANSASYQKYFS